MLVVFAVFLLAHEAEPRMCKVLVIARQSTVFKKQSGGVALQQNGG